MSRVVKHGSRYFIAWEREGTWVAPCKDGALAIVGPFEVVVTKAPSFTRKAEAEAAAKQLYPFANTAFDRSAA